MVQSLVSRHVFSRLNIRHMNAEKKGKKKQRLEEASEGSIYDSDDIDNELVVEAMKARQSKARQARKSQPQPKRRKVSNELGEIELEEGQELVGIVVQAPKTGLVPAGQLSENTLNFLRKLDNLECNNRKWYVLVFCSNFFDNNNRRFKLHGKTHPSLSFWSNSWLFKRPYIAPRNVNGSRLLRHSRIY